MFSLTVSLGALKHSLPLQTSAATGASSVSAATPGYTLLAVSCARTKTPHSSLTTSICYTTHHNGTTIQIQSARVLIESVLGCLVSITHLFLFPPHAHVTRKKNDAHTCCMTAMRSSLSSKAGLHCLRRPRTRVSKSDR